MMIRRACSVIVVAAAVLAAPVIAADDTTREALLELPHVVDEVMHRWDVPGVALAVVYDGEVVFTGGFGVRDLAGQEPVTAKTMFSAASTTKAFTAVAMGMLVDEGSVKLDLPVRAYLPDFAVQDNHASAKLTIRDLLAHRTGMRRHDAVWYRSDASRDELISRLKYLRLTSGIREKFFYNNLMYMVAGRVVGKVSGGTWEDFVADQIFEPLGMDRSLFGTPPPGDPDVARPYVLNADGEVIPALPYTGWAIAPASSICTTADDLSQWLRLLLGNGVHGNRRLLSPEFSREIFTPQMVVSVLGPAEEPITTYGLGWFVQTYRGRLMAWHTGSIDGYYSMVALLPTDGLGVAILTNRSDHFLPEVMSRWVFDRFLGLPEINWSEHLEFRDATIQKAQGEALAVRETIRKPGTSPSAPTGKLAGRYRHPAYGDFVVSDEGGTGLSAVFHGMTGPLEHFHDNAFLFKLDRYELRDEFVIRFQFGTDSSVLSMAATMEDGVPPVVFMRLSSESPEATPVP